MRLKEAFISAYKLNTISAYRMSMACPPHLEQAANGSITNSGSFSSAVPAYDIPPYATAKAALNQMMASLAHMLNKRVRVSVATAVLSLGIVAGLVAAAVNYMTIAAVVAPAPQP